MPKNEKSKRIGGTDGSDLSRRAALTRLGLAATAAYVAPTIMHIDRSANALVVPSPCSSKKKNRGRNRRCR